ncbi:uncharacterized protein EpC_03130 [Erwinia pyrifoliae Ep1/96]|nr:uncharacterized protein EpC_03130 [Erwinia pyrifoliae Ep1/96]
MLRHRVFYFFSRNKMRQRHAALPFSPQLRIPIPTSRLKSGKLCVTLCPLVGQRCVCPVSFGSVCLQANGNNESPRDGYSQ